MDLKLQIFFICFALFFLFIILYYLVRKKLNLRYTLVWLITVTVLLVLAIFPVIVEKVGSLIGIVSPVNTVFLFSTLFMLIIILTLTGIVSHMNTRVYKLTQTQALLEKRVRELESRESQEKNKAE
jgi:hypothetical protein